MSQRGFGSWEDVLTMYFSSKSRRCAICSVLEEDKKINFRPCWRLFVAALFSLHFCYPAMACPTCDSRRFFSSSSFLDFDEFQLSDDDIKCYFVEAKVRRNVRGGKNEEIFIASLTSLSSLILDSRGEFFSEWTEKTISFL